MIKQHCSPYIKTTINGLDRPNSQTLSRGTLLISLLVLFCLFLPGICMAAKLPDPNRDLYVLDQAGVMSEETRAMIVNSSEELARLTKAQIAVVTLKSLDGQVLEEVSLGILRKWQLGDKKLNNGVLILLVTDDHLSRIEVGYGLEGALTDGKTGQIQDEYMLPYYKEGSYDQGLRNGYKAIFEEVAKEYQLNISVNTTQEASPEQDKLPTWLNILGIIVILLLIWLDYRYLNGFLFGFLLGILFRGGGRGGGGGGGSIGGGGSGGGGGSSRGW